eukprot:335113_1
MGCGSSTSNLYVIGRNDNGQLGLNHTKDIKSLIQHTVDINIDEVHTGNQHTIFITSDHDADHQYYASGNNEHGQCPINDCSEIINYFAPVEYFSTLNIKINKIFCSTNSNSVFWCGVKDDIYANGKNDKYQLGMEEEELEDSDNEETNKSKPDRVIALRNIKDIKSGDNHSVAIDHEGHVYCAGNAGNYGYIYIPHFDDEKLQTRPWNQIQSFAIKDKKITSISCGCYHTLFLDLYGCVYSAGSNVCKVLGHEQTSTEMPKWIVASVPYFRINKIIVSSIASGSSHNLCI